MPVHRSPFGNGASLYHMEAANVRVAVTDFGAALVSLAHPDGTNVVLDLPDAAAYQVDTQFLGIIAGRYANRIANGRFRLNDEAWILPCNDGPHHLHGGPDGFGKRLWSGKIDDAENAVTFTLISPHLDQGYPGAITAQVTYQLRLDGELHLTLSARSDRPSIVNLTSHAYFNLAGGGNILGHEVKLYADLFTPMDEDGIPNGDVAGVAGTPFDYRQWSTIDPAVDQNLLIDGKGGTLRPAGEIRDPQSGRHLLMLATAPALQLYAGKHLGAGGVYAANDGLCLEPQYCPDSPNQDAFTTPRVTPETPYCEEIAFRFV